MALKKSFTFSPTIRLLFGTLVAIPSPPLLLLLLITLICSKMNKYKYPSPLKFFTYDELLRVARWTDSEEAPNPCDIFPESSLLRLDRARQLAGIPFVVNSSYRSPAYEVSKGRSGTSAHCHGRAFDIKCRSSRERFKIVSSALNAGFTRIGIYPSFVHLDDSPEHDQCVIWYGK